MDSFEVETIQREKRFVGEFQAIVQSKDHFRVLQAAFNVYFVQEKRRLKMFERNEN